MYKKLIILVLYLAATLMVSYAQDPSTVNVSELTDQQIQAIVNEVNARGLTLEQSAQMARLQGASPQQVEELMIRIREMGTEEETTDRPLVRETDDKTLSTKDKLPTKIPVKATEKEKKIFGFQFFNSEKLTFEPPVNIPTPQNYVLGIGDELTIVVWGASQKTYKLKVESSGAIVVPDLGPVAVAGMEFVKAKEMIRKRLTAIYQGLGGATPNTLSDVTVSALRSISVHVIGEAKTPGTYTLPATASAFNALYLSGGPGENGSFRNIQVIRDNQVVKTIDVYNYLINGIMGENIQLREQDIINIPVYEKRITAMGSFKRTGFFELKEAERLSDLLRYTGGFSEMAYQAQVSIRRITGTEKKWIDVGSSIFDSFIPANGDSVVASDVANRYANRVAVNGAVFRPGFYELTDGLTLSGLLKKAQGVREDYYNRGIIMRLQQDLTPMVLSFEIENILNGTDDILLQREDQVIIQTVLQMKEKQNLQIFGEVRMPGEYDYAANMSIKDLIVRAGGFNEAASGSFIEVARRHNIEESGFVRDELVKLYQFNIDRNLVVDEKSDTFKLEPFDYVYVRRAPSYHGQRTVYIVGEVRYPGAYSIGSKNERVSDLVKRAGGLMPNAYVKGASMKRINEQAGQKMDVLQGTLDDSLLVKVESQISNSQLELRLESILREPGTAFDYLLKDGDQIIIPEFSQEVRISGEIRNPIGLAFEDGKSLKYYVERNGGFGDKADKSKVFVIYSDGTTKVTKNFIWPVYPAIEPGSQIVIPPKVEKIKIDNTGKWLGVASTLASVLIAIATIARP